MATVNERKRRKVLRNAAEIKRNVNKRRNIFIIVVVVCLILLAIYTAALTLGILTTNGIFQSLAIVVAIGAGMFSISYTQENKRYKAYLQENSITNKEVKEQIALEKGK